MKPIESMKFKDYIRQMDDEEFAAFLVRAEDLDVCDFCAIADSDVPCIEEYCIEAMQNFLEKDVKDSVFDDFFPGCAADPGSVP